MGRTAETNNAGERRYRKLIENIHDTVTVVDAAGAPIWTTASIRRDLGYEANFWEGADLFGLVHPEDRLLIEALLGRLVEHPDETVRGEVRLRRPAGDYSHVGFSAANRLTDPDIGGIVVTARPIDDEVHARQATADREIELNKALADRASFIAGLSHEMRSPLHTIVGLSELVLSSPTLADEHRIPIEAIGRESAALRVMIDELLDFSKISAGRLLLLDEPFSPAAVVDAVGRAYRAAAIAKGLDFIVEIDPALPLVVLGDEHRLRQILVNFVTNAIKYTSTGSIRIDAVAVDEGELRFSVADTGPGIPDEALEFLFRPYEQVHRSHAVKGTGLGLAITKSLVELAGGTLDLDTGTGGTRFWCDLPLQRARRSTDRPVAAASLDPETPPADGGLILVVDDSNVNQLLAISQLERLGYRSVVASSGAEALRLVGAERFDAVLMDWHMPEMDGLETTRRIRANETGPPIPIITTTASAMSGDRERCLEAGASDYLPKPISLAELGAAVTKWTRRSIAPNETTATMTRNRIEKLVNELGDASLVAAVISTFLDELGGWRSEFEVAVADDDRATVRRVAHTVKSTAEMLGATHLTVVCEGIEAAVDHAQIESLAQSFADSVARATTELVDARSALLATAEPKQEETA